MSARLGVSRPTDAAQAGGAPIFDCLIEQARLSEMVRQKLRFPGDGFRGMFFVCLADSCVQFLALASEQCTVRGVTHQCMFERVICIRWHTPAEGQPRSNQHINALRELVLRHVGDGRQ